MKSLLNNFLSAAAGCLTFALASTSLAAAEELPKNHWYTKFDIGVAALQPIQTKSVGGKTAVPPAYFPVFTSDPATRVDLAIGYQVSRYFAAEVQAGHMTSSLDSSAGDFTQIPVLLNGIFRYPNRTHLEPFIGVGLGAVEVIIEDDRFNTRDYGLAFACEPVAGLNYQITPRFHVGVKYKYLLTSDIPFHGDAPVDFVVGATTTHTVSLEIGYRF